MRTKLEKRVNETLQGLAGLPMKSKCLKYNRPSSTCVWPYFINQEVLRYGPVAYQDGVGFTLSYSDSGGNGKTTITLQQVPYNSTKVDEFGVARSLEDFRVPSLSINTMPKDVYGTFFSLVQQEEGNEHFFCRQWKVLRGVESK